MSEMEKAADRLVQEHGETLIALGEQESEVRAEPVYALMSADEKRLVAEAETLDAILLAAATVSSEGESLDELVVFAGGKYDPATTALVQEGLVT